MCKIFKRSIGLKSEKPRSPAGVAVIFYSDTGVFENALRTVVVEFVQVNRKNVRIDSVSVQNGNQIGAGTGKTTKSNGELPVCPDR